MGQRWDNGTKLAGQRLAKRPRFGGKFPDENATFSHHPALKREPISLT